MGDLAAGRLRWDMIFPFPQDSDEDRKIGDESVAQLSALLIDQVDPEEIDRSGELPDDLVDLLRRDGWLALGTAPELGGRGLSAFNAFRAVHTAASWSMPVAQVMAVQAAIGVGALLPVVPAGPLRDHLLDRVSAGMISGSADTEAGGAANQGRQTTATPVDGGAAFLLNGEKIHIGNGPLAQTLIVSATIHENGSPARRLFVVDRDSPGFQIHARHEFMGLRGFPVAALTFTDVRVPREHMLVESNQHDTRLTPKLVELIVTGRMYLIAAPSLAVARRCVGWMREFAGRRVIDGRPLTDYDQIQREIADSLADTFAIDTVTRWCLHDRPGRAANLLLEQNAAKNIASVTCWRVLDRTMSLLAGEGFETAASKAARGAAPLPLERAYRDARAFRISGGVDYLLDYWGSQLFTLSQYYPEHDEATRIEAGPPDTSWCARTPLTSRNQRHLAEVSRQTHLFAQTMLRWSRERSRQQLGGQQRRLILLNQVLNELTTAALVLARAASSAGAPVDPTAPDDVQELADLACTTARTRLADYWNQLGEEQPPDHAAVTARWMRHGMDALGGDLVETEARR